MNLSSKQANTKFFFIGTKPFLDNRTELKNFLNSIFQNEGVILNSLTYVFCTDEYLLEINKQYLHHDYYTDIITFNLGKENEAVDGEIYISIDRVRDNSKRLNQYFKIELHRVIFHGALHLCGYTDKLKVDKSLMTVMENKYLKQYFD